MADTIVTAVIIPVVNGVLASLLTVYIKEKRGDRELIQKLLVAVGNYSWVYDVDALTEEHIRSLIDAMRKIETSVLRLANRNLTDAYIECQRSLDSREQSPKVIISFFNELKLL